MEPLPVLVKHLSRWTCLDVVQVVCNPIDGSTTEASSSIVDPVGRQVAESEVCGLLTTASKAIYDNEVDGLAGERKPQSDCFKADHPLDKRNRGALDLFLPISIYQHRLHGRTHHHNDDDDDDDGDDGAKVTLAVIMMAIAMTMTMATMMTTTRRG